jgi:hypothetical protein
MAEEAMTQEQLDKLAGLIKPAIAAVIGARPEQDLYIRVTITTVPEGPLAGAQVLHWVMKLDGQDLAPEQEAKVTEFLRAAGGQAVPIKNPATA